MAPTPLQRPWHAAPPFRLVPLERRKWPTTSLKADTDEHKRVNLGSLLRARNLGVQWLQRRLSARGTPLGLSWTISRIKADTDEYSNVGLRGLRLWVNHESYFQEKKIDLSVQWLQRRFSARGTPLRLLGFSEVDNNKHQVWTQTSTKVSTWVFLKGS